jgi:hypothetical protein
MAGDAPLNAWLDAQADGIALALMVSLIGVAFLLVAAAIETWLKRRAR